MRRIILEEPLSKAAAWSRSFALFSSAVALIGIVMARAGLDATAAVAIEGGAMFFALASIVFAVAAMVVIWRTGYRGMGRVLTALLIAALVLFYPAFLFVEAHGVPILSDVSTDLVEPPNFSRSPRAAAARNGVTPQDVASAQKDLQRQLYPELQPIVLDMEAMDAHRLILKLMNGRRWRIVDDAVPLGRFGVGHIDAIATTTVMGFPADVAVRIRPLGSQTRIDIRSVSRTAWNGPSSNVDRIQSFASDLDDQTDQ